SFLRRLGRQPSRGQLWLLSGGPGGTAFGAKDAGDFLGAYLSDLDVYLPDHRGVGESTPLSCAALPVRFDDASLPAFAACGEALREAWGAPALARFSSEMAGRDVAALIDATRAPTHEVYLLGPSYGSRWALRALAHLGAPPTGVVLDALVPEDMTMMDSAQACEDAAEALFARCGADAVCRDKLGADPWQKVADVLARVDEGHCPTARGLDRGDYAFMLAALVRAPARALAPAFVHRLDRCGPGDEAAILHVLALLEQPGLPTEEFGEPLSLHVRSSELWPAELPSRAAMAAFEAGLRVTSGDLPQLRDLAAGWPAFRFTPAAYPETDVPLLVLSRTHDPATSLAGTRKIEPSLSGDYQRLVEVAGFGHTTSGSVCGVDLMLDFFENPYAPLDTTCAPNADDLRFTGTVFDATAQGIFDAPAWDDP
ncbi:MAG: alpha/beta fold hydrolase, partial [Deltaproteobacteria bacterium]|nr:alpha/beta fold hydrolase [Deltaproteobacteria bacterium]